MSEPSRNDGYKGVEAKDSELDERAQQYAAHCRSSAQTLMGLVTTETELEGSAIEVSDTVVVAYAVSAYETYKVLAGKHQQVNDRLIDGCQLHPVEVFLGMSLVLLETPAAERATFIDNMARYLVRQWQWDLDQLYHGVLLPTVTRFAHLVDEPVPLSPKLFEPVNTATLAACVISDEIYTKLRHQLYEPTHPVTKQLWEKFKVVMRSLRGIPDLTGPMAGEILSEGDMLRVAQINNERPSLVDDFKDALDAVKSPKRGRWTNKWED